jgi:hypothetical protein
MVNSQGLREGTRCVRFGAHVVQAFSECSRCGKLYGWCEECQVNTTCCGCGFNHAITCTEP